MAEGWRNAVSRILHIVPGCDDVANGMVVVARLFAKEQGDAEVVDLNHETTFAKAMAVKIHEIHEKGVEEVWVHGMWLPREWAACWKVLRTGKRLVRMTHGSLSPVYLKMQSPWMKRIVGPVERWLLRRASRIVATCEAEKGWIEEYLGGRCPAVEVSDLKRFYDFGHVEQVGAGRVGELGNHVEQVGTCRGVGTENGERGTGNGEREGALHILYLGRRHPLKGVEYLETALGKCENVKLWKYGNMEIPNGEKEGIVFRVESEVCGEEKEKVWAWCDVLVLPTLSENFGLVVAEALERGKRVITTDGAPAWNHEIHETHEKGVWCGYGGRLIYLKGYREGSDEKRVELLKEAIERFC